MNAEKSEVTLLQGKVGQYLLQCSAMYNCHHQSVGLTLVRLLNYQYKEWNMINRKYGQIFRLVVLTTVL
jgi:hypothetical protein